MRQLRTLNPEFSTHYCENEYTKDQNFVVMFVIFLLHNNMLIYLTKLSQAPFAFHLLPASCTSILAWELLV